MEPNTDVHEGTMSARGEKNDLQMFTLQYK